MNAETPNPSSQSPTETEKANTDAAKPVPQPKEQVFVEPKPTHPFSTDLTYKMPAISTWMM